MKPDSPVLNIDSASAVPVYRQIAQGLRTMLVHGVLAPGTRLSTIRELAMDLGVHPNTVAQAYRILAVEGWLDLRRRLGATVLTRNVPQAGPEAIARWNQRLDEAVAEALAAGVPPETVANTLIMAANTLGNHSPAKGVEK